MAKKRTRADILREIADLEDELRCTGCDLKERKNKGVKLEYEFIEDKILDLHKTIAGIPMNSNMKAYEYHIISNVELDLEQILREGIKGILL